MVFGAFLFVFPFALFLTFLYDGFLMAFRLLRCKAVMDHVFLRSQGNMI